LREIKLKAFHADADVESGNTEIVHTEVMPSQEQLTQKSRSEIAHTESASTDQQPSPTQDHRLRFGYEELFETSLALKIDAIDAANAATISTSNASTGGSGSKRRKAPAAVTETEALKIDAIETNAATTSTSNDSKGGSCCEDHRLRFGYEELFETSLDMDDLKTPITNNATITDKPQLKTLIAILMTENKEWFSNKFSATFITPGTNTVCLDKYTATVRLFLDPAWNVDTKYPEYSAYMHTNDMGAPYLELAICMRCIGLASVPATVCGATGFRVERNASTQQKPKPDDNTMLVSARTNCVFCTVV
jgi:hypothetical protein